MKNNDLFLNHSKRFVNQPLENNINQKVGESFTGLNFNDWPTLVDFETKEYFSKVSIGIFNLIKRIPEIFNFDINKIQDYYKLPLIDIERALEGLNINNQNSIIGRGDFIVDKDNEIKCIEFNVGCSLGGWQIDFIEDLYLESSFISSFLESNKFEMVPNKFFCSLFDFLISIKNDSLVLEQSNCVNIALVHSLYELVNQNNVSRIKDIYKKWSLENNQKGDIIFCSFDEMRQENGRYKYNDTTIHCILDLEDKITGEVGCNGVNIVCAPVKRILDNKLNIVVLSENEDSPLFSQEERAIIKNNIPWTRKLNNELVDFHGEYIRPIEYALKNKDMFVIKPVFGLGGIDACIGSKTSEAEWQDRIIKCGEGEPFVVQEYIKPQINVYHDKISGFDYFETILGLFVFGSTYGGGFTRSMCINSKEGIINSSNGAEEGVLFVVK